MPWNMHSFVHQIFYRKHHIPFLLHLVLVPYVLSTLKNNIVHYLMPYKLKLKQTNKTFIHWIGIPVTALTPEMAGFWQFLRGHVLTIWIRFYCLDPFFILIRKEKFVLTFVSTHPIGTFLAFSHTILGCPGFSLV